MPQNNRVGSSRGWSLHQNNHFKGGMGRIHYFRTPGAGWTLTRTACWGRGCCSLAVGRCVGHRPVIVTHPSAPQPVGTLFRSWLDEARVGSGDIVLQKYGVASLSQSGRFRGMGTDVCLGFIRFQLQRLRPAASTRRVKESVLLSPPGLWNQTFGKSVLGYQLTSAIL